MEGESTSLGSDVSLSRRVRPKKKSIPSWMPRAEEGTTAGSLDYPDRRGKGGVPSQKRRGGCQEESRITIFLIFFKEKDKHSPNNGTKR